MSELRAKLPELLPLIGSRARALCRNPVDAADLVQDTVERAMRFEHQFLAGSNLRSWILQIEHTLFITRCREAARKRRILGTVATEVQVLGNHFPEPHGMTEPLKRALDTLHPAHAEVLRLVDAEGYSYVDAAAALDVPVGTVMSRLFRGRRLLAKKLAGVRHV